MERAIDRAARAPGAPEIRPGSARAWLLASRPATLTAALVPVMVGTAVAHATGGVRVVPALAALFGAFMIQIGTNLANDVFDHEKGADTEARLGPTRAVQAGLLTARAVRVEAVGARARQPALAGRAHLRGAAAAVHAALDLRGDRRVGRLLREARVGRLHHVVEARAPRERRHVRGHQPVLRRRDRPRLACTDRSLPARIGAELAQRLDRAVARAAPALDHGRAGEARLPRVGPGRERALDGAAQPLLRLVFGQIVGEHERSRVQQIEPRRSRSRLVARRLDQVLGRARVAEPEQRCGREQRAARPGERADLHLARRAHRRRRRLADPGRTRREGPAVVAPHVELDVIAVALLRDARHHAQRARLGDLERGEPHQRPPAALESAAQHPHAARVDHRRRRARERQVNRLRPGHVDVDHHRARALQVGRRVDVELAPIGAHHDRSDHRREGRQPRVARGERRPRVDGRGVFERAQRRPVERADHRRRRRAAPPRAPRRRRLHVAHEERHRVQPGGDRAADEGQVG